MKIILKQVSVVNGLVIYKFLNFNKINYINSHIELEFTNYYH